MRFLAEATSYGTSRSSRIMRLMETPSSFRGCALRRFQKGSSALLRDPFIVSFTNLRPGLEQLDECGYQCGLCDEHPGHPFDDVVLGRFQSGVQVVFRDQFLAGRVTESF